MDQADYWQTVEDLVNEALALPAPERRKLLLSIEDASVRSEVESLLRDNDNGGGLELADAFAEAASVVMESSATPMEGRRLGRFQLLHRIGAGGTSEVFLATDLELGRNVALKLLSRRFNQAEQAQRFRREAVAASALSHPNILTIYDIGQDDGQTFIATEYVEGESLRLRLARGALSPEEAVSIARQLASALAATHDQGILHRDISPSNIMIRSDGLVKLLDFGLARMESQSDQASLSTPGGRTIEGTVLGTPSYMSPEQARGRRVDERSDLWGLGAVLYEMLTGEGAFQGDSVSDILVSVLERQPCRPSMRNAAIPPALDDLVLKLLSKNPEGRPSSAAQVQRELQILAEDKSPKESAIRKGRFGTSFSAVRIWGLLVAILLVCALAWWYARRNAGLQAPVLSQITATLAENRVTAAAVSRDGNKLAYAGLGGSLIVQDLKNGNRELLPAPENAVIDAISWMGASGQILISAETDTHARTLWAVDLTKSQLRLIRRDARRGIASQDGQTIAFTSGDESEIWIMNAGGGDARKLVTGGSTDTFPLLVLSPDSRRLFYQRRHYAPDSVAPLTRDDGENNYRRTFEAIDLSGRMIDSTSIRMTSACMLGDGRILYLQEEEQRAYDFNVWELRTSGQTGNLNGRSRRLTEWRDKYLAGISCSADGSFVGVLMQTSQSDIYLAELADSSLHSVRRMTLEDKSEYPHAWTTDSLAVVFEMPSKSGWDLYIQRIEDRVAHPLATGNDSKITPQVSPDGKWVLFCAYREGPAAARTNQKLMRIPVQGGAQEVIPTGPFDEFRCSLPAGKHCVLRTIENRQYVYSELDPVRGRGKELARIAWTPGILGDWALSPDGSEVAVPNHDSREARISLISLDASAGHMSGSRELLVPGLGGLRGLVATANNEGWFASANSSRGVKLLHIDRKGGFRVLRECPIATWGLPSPDGRRLAFVDQTLFSNLWSVALF